MVASRIGDQLFLEGFEQLDGVRAPWGGRSPRELTAAYDKFTLKAQAGKSVSDFVNSDQYDLWLPTEKAPWKYQGAPLLNPFKEVEHG